MKFRNKTIALLLAAAVTTTGITGCGKTAAKTNDEAGATTETAADAEATEAAGEEGEAISADMVTGTFKPSETAIQAQESYEYPFLGLQFSIPGELQNQMKEQKVAMITTEDETNRTNAVTYAYVSWNEMTEEQKNQEVDKLGTGYEEWIASLARIGTLGVYDEDSQKKLDEITGCTEHKELGNSSDGKYKYYLSLRKDAPEELKKELEAVETMITEMTAYQQISVFEQPQDTSEQGENVTSVGSFETKGIDGETYTEKIFADHKLTLVNVFTTWCSPCVEEIPELEKLYEEMKDQGVGVTGVVLDSADENGNADEDTVKKAGILQEKTKALYPFLIPDTTMMNGRLKGISAFPETFFVNQNGNIVGETYTGSHTLDEWKKIVEKELAKISE